MRVILGNADVNRVGTFKSVEESLTECGPLERDGGD